jgi:hypothetical protein
MNVLKIFLPGLLAIAGSAAYADGTVVTQAYEVALSNFRLPGSPNGTLAFRTCDECDTLTIRVTVGTNYVVNQDSMELKDFRKSLARVRDRAAATVVVMHHLETDTVTSVRIEL